MIVGDAWSLERLNMTEKSFNPPKVQVIFLLTFYLHPLMFTTLNIPIIIVTYYLYLLIFIVTYYYDRLKFEKCAADN
jgi:hypothetical protein